MISEFVVWLMFIDLLDVKCNASPSFTDMQTLTIREGNRSAEALSWFYASIL